MARRRGRTFARNHASSYVCFESRGVGRSRRARGARAAPAAHRQSCLLRGALPAASRQVRRQAGCEPEAARARRQLRCVAAIARVQRRLRRARHDHQTGGFRSAFGRVDYDYVLAVARAGRQAGATRLGVVSALGADAKSRVFYNRVKGEMQDALGALDYESVIIAQPSLLMGDREALGQPTRAGEVWARRLLGPVAGLIPASFRPVSAHDVARALLRATLVASTGITIVPSRDMHATAEA